MRINLKLKNLDIRLRVCVNFAQSIFLLYVCFGSQKLGCKLFFINIKVFNNTHVVDKFIICTCFDNVFMYYTSTVRS